MTALLDLAPAGTPPALLGAAEIQRILDGVLAADHSATGPAALGEALAEWRRIESRVAAVRHELLRQADRAQAARRSGATDTGSWAARITQADSDAAAREVRLARDLRQADSPVRSALSAGRIQPGHASVIAGATRDLPAGITAEQRHTVEQHLVDKAATLSPRRLRRAAKRALEAIEPDPAVVDAHENDLLKTEEDRAYAATRLTLHDNADGTTTGHFTVPRLHGDLLRKLLDTMTAPRRAALGASAAMAGSADERRDPAHQRGLALLELLEHTPTDRLSGKTNATVLVSSTLDTLRGRLEAAGVDTGHAISAGETRRLACGAGLLPAVLGGESLPLDLGRTRRLHTEAQRVALATVHSHCAAEGCERPFAWTEIHHLTPWSRGGRTDLRDAVPLCWFHHRRIHDPEYEHRVLPDASIRFARRA